MRPERYYPTSSLECTLRFDLEALSYLKFRYGSQIERAIAELEKLDFDYSSFNKVYKSGLDRNLAFRQGFPVCIVDRENFSSGQGLTDILVCFFLGQTMVLNHIDRHLDLSSSYTISNPIDLLRDVRVTTCYAVALQYEAAIQASTRCSNQYFLKSMYKTSRYIIQSMHENYATRFHLDRLLDTQAQTDFYLSDDNSPLLGSGFYQSGIEGCYSYYDEELSGDFLLLVKKMRILRQKIDQIADFREDLSTGMISLPALFLLNTGNENCYNMIRELWAYVKSAISKCRDNAQKGCAFVQDDGLITNMMESIFQEMEKYGIWNKLYDDAKSDWEECSQILEKVMGDNRSDISVVIDLKMAFLDRLKLQGWQDIPVSHKILE